MPVTGSRSAKVTLPSDEEILITRDFDAPKHLVWKAWTTPELIKRWWSGRRGEVTIAEVDLRVGGAWRFAMVADGGFEVAFHGEYREIVPNERLVQTEVYEGMPDAQALDTMTLTEVDGRTSADAAGAAPRQAIARRSHQLRHGGRPAGRARPARGGCRLAQLRRRLRKSISSATTASWSSPS